MSLLASEPLADFDCPRCGRPLQVARRLEGRKVICPACEAQIEIPIAVAGPSAGEEQGGTMEGERPSQPAAPPAEEWFCSVNGRQYGPMSRPALLAEIRSGRFSPILPVWRSGMADWALASQVPELQQAGLPSAPVPVPGLSRMPESRHELSWLPLWLLVLLHYATFGMFSLVWFNLMHGRMPKIRGDDPSAARAIGFLLIPVFNLYWFFFTHLRLCERLNDLRVQHGLAPDVPESLATAMCLLSLVPVVGIFGWLVVAPIFYGITQAKINELIERG